MGIATENSKRVVREESPVRKQFDLGNQFRQEGHKVIDASLAFQLQSAVNQILIRVSSGSF